MNHFIKKSFQVPNCLVDKNLNLISGAGTKILLIIIRKTRGWHKEVDSISLSQLEKISGQSRPTVIRAKNELLKFGLIVEMPTTRYGNSYKLSDENGISLVVRFPNKIYFISTKTEGMNDNYISIRVKIFNYSGKVLLLSLVKKINTHKTTIKNNFTNKKINKKKRFFSFGDATLISSHSKMNQPRHFNKIQKPFVKRFGNYTSESELGRMHGVIGVSK